MEDDDILGDESLEAEAEAEKLTGECRQAAAAPPPVLNLGRPK